MKKKFLIILIILLIIIGIALFIFFNGEETKTITEYEPGQEITDDQMRKTIISLYYKNKKTGLLVPEGRLVDVKILLENPYKTIFEMLMGNSKNDELKSVIPEKTKINKIELKNGILFLDLSKEFIENHPNGENEEKATIKAITNSLCELTEVNGVKILIDGKENTEFKDKKINFKNIFTKVD